MTQQLELLADHLAIATSETLPEPSPSADRPVPVDSARLKWVRAQADEYVKAVGTLRPRISEAKALLERAAAIRDETYVPLERLREAEQLEEEARIKLLRAGSQRARAERILRTMAVRLR